jgi:hypothetical protein
MYVISMYVISFIVMAVVWAVCLYRDEYFLSTDAGEFLVMFTLILLIGAPVTAPILLGLAIAGVAFVSFIKLLVSNMGKVVNWINLYKSMKETT